MSGNRTVTVVLEHRRLQRGRRYLFLSEKHKLTKNDLERMKRDGWDVSVIDKKYVEETT